MNKAQQGYIEVAGGKIWYWQNGSNNIPLIVIHGGPGATHNYLISLKELAADRSVIFYDQLGSGKSDQPSDTSLWTVARFTSELAQLIEFFQLQKVNLLGHSWGTILAVEYFLKKPAQVQSLILASPCLKMEMWHKDTEINISKLPGNIQMILDKYKGVEIVQAEEHQLALLQYYRNYICRMKPWPQLLMETMAASNDEVYKSLWGNSELYVTGSLRDYDITARLAEITVPTLFTCGRYDEASPATTAYLQSLIPNAAIAIFENSAHLPHLEEARAYNSVIADFLNSTDSIRGAGR
jgi:proline iminopeptidase